MTTPVILTERRGWEAIRLTVWSMPIAAVGIFPICGSVTGPVSTVGGVNPSLTIQAIACRTADRIKVLRAAASLRLGRVRPPERQSTTSQRPL